MDSETGSDQPASGVASAIPATLVLAPDRAEEQSTPVYDWLVVGRECAGVDERHRLLIENPAVSRTASGETTVGTRGHGRYDRACWLADPCHSRPRPASAACRKGGPSDEL